MRVCEQAVEGSHTNGAHLPVRRILPHGGQLRAGKHLQCAELLLLAVRGRPRYLVSRLIQHWSLCVCVHIHTYIQTSCHVNHMFSNCVLWVVCQPSAGIVRGQLRAEVFCRLDLLRSGGVLRPDLGLSAVPPAHPGLRALRQPNRLLTSPQCSAVQCSAAI